MAENMRFLGNATKLVILGGNNVSKVVIFGIFGKIKLVIFGKTGYICCREVKNDEKSPHF